MLTVQNETLLDSSWVDYAFKEPKLSNCENPTILAFSCYFHDSSACILKDGKIIAAADEERFTRKKHDANFPEHAIKFCLEVAQVEKVDHVVFYENPDVKWERIQDCLEKNPPEQALKEHIIKLWKQVKSTTQIQQTFHRTTGLSNSVIFLDHHLCHAASSYYMSGFDKAAVVVLDGVGEKATSSYGVCKNRDLELKQCIEFPHSVGLIYTAVTVFLGFKANDHEYKVMGLAPYGEMDKDKNPFYEKFLKLFDLKADGSFELNMRYFGHQHFGAPPFTSEFIELLGVSPNPRGGDMNLAHKDIAAALQLVTEDLVFHILNHVYQVTNCKNLCFSGGVALNSVLNGKILSKTPFKKLWIQPSAGDGGTVIGAAKYVQAMCDPTSSKEHMQNVALGPSFHDHQIRSCFDKKGIKYREYETHHEMIEETAKLLNDKKVIGWFQQGMEWGPRALGHRSILASPIHEDMRDILNAKVKHRELFRPFAPVVCADDAPTYFECDEPVPEPTDYMLMVYPIKKHVRHLLPAVTHVDGSGRLQTIRRHQNELYYNLIKSFGALSKVPILVNTSFNIRGEPIVCSPSDAYKCMMGTEIDCLVIDRFIVHRSENMQDVWQPTIED